MKRTRKLITLLILAVFVLTLAGCGASAKSASATAAPAEAWSVKNDAAAAAGFASYDNGYYEMAEEEAVYAAEAPAAPMPEPAASTAGTGAEPQNMSEKIIYSADASLETINFDDALNRIYALVDELGGFMESTGISGTDYYSESHGYKNLRYANFTIRVPSENFTQLTGTLSDIGNVPYCNTYSQNVTQTYYDVQSRLTAYRTQETRLLEMLAIAESVEDLLAIQDQLTEVQYQIDSLTGTLKYYDHQVSYSTVSLYVQEVEEYTPQTAAHLSYGQKLAQGLRGTMKDIGSFFSNAFLWLVSSLPALVLVAAVGVGVYFWVRRSVRRHRAKKAEQSNPNVQ